MTIRLRTLGDLGVLIDGREVPEMCARPVRLALIVYLALERQVSRDKIMALLWPESDQEHARQALRQTLYALRQELGDAWLEANHATTLHASATLTADAAELLEAADAGDPRRVAVLYGGGFLDGAHLAASQPLQLWCDQWRARLARLHREARRTLIDGAVAAGDLASALGEAQEWLALDPLEDEAQHRVIEILFRLGRREDAVRQYESYAAILAREGLEPLEDTRALVARMRSSGNGLPSLPATPDAELRDERKPGASSQRPAFLRLRVLVPLVVLVVLGAVFVVVQHARAARPELDPTRVLVVPLVNETGDSALNDIGRLAAEWITHTVTRLGPLKSVPTLDVIQMLDAGISGEEAAGERHAGTLVSGRFFRVRDSLELHVQVTDVKSGELWDALAPVRVTPDRPEAGLREVTDRVAGGLAIRFIPGTPLPPPSVLAPPNLAAFQAIMDAAAFVRRGDWAGALPHLERAARLDPTYFRAHLFVASAFFNLERYAEAESVLASLEPKRDGFSEYERTLFQTARAMLSGDRQGELEAVTEGARLDPGGTLHYISAGVALAAGRPRAAIELYASLDPNCPWAPEALFTWANWTGAFHLLENHSRELEEARRARVLHPDQLLPLFLELRALAALGRLDQLRATLHEAAAMAPEPRWNAGLVLYLTAEELEAHRHGAAAREVLDSALAWYRSRTEGEATSIPYRFGYTQALLAAGDLDDAAAVIATLRQQLPEDVDFLGLEGIVAARRGDRAHRDEVLRALDTNGRPYQFGAVPYWRAAIAAWSGEEQDALRFLWRSFDEGRPRGILLHADGLLEPLWTLPSFALAVSEDH